MAAAIIKYNNYILKQHTGNAIDWDTIPIKMMLTSVDYAPDIETHVFKSSIVGEITGGNYISGGSTLNSISVNQTNGILTISANSVIWLQHASGFTNARYGIIYGDTGDNNTSLLVGYINFGSNKGNVSGDLILNFNSTPNHGVLLIIS